MTAMEICSREALLADCRAAGEDHQGLSEFLGQVYAPPVLFGLERVARNSVTVLSLVAHRSPAAEFAAAAKRWLPVVRWVKKYSGTTAIAVPAEVGGLKSTGDRRNPMLGRGAKQHSLWTLLWESHADRCSRSTFRILQAYMLSAHVAIMRGNISASDWARHEPPYPEYYLDLYYPLLSARNLARASTGTMSTLRTVLTHSGPQELPENLKRLAAVIQGNSTEEASDVADDLISIAWFVRWGLDPKNHRRKYIEGRRSPDTGQEDECKSRSTRSWQSIDYTEGVSALPGLRLSEGEREKLLALGDCPDEDAQVPGPVFAEDDTGVRLVNAGWIEMRNQLLPWSWEDLSIAEMACLLRQLRDSAASGDRDAVEMFAAVNTMFWVGCPIADLNVVSAEVGNRSDDSARIALASVPHESSATLDVWRIQALELPLATRPEPIPGARPLTPWLSLPDHAGAGGPVRDLVLTDGSAASQRPFQRKEDWYRGELKKICSNRVELDRITPEAISRVLFRSILQQTGHDMVAAALISGRDETLAFVRRFYATPTVEFLQRIYIDTTKAMLGELAGAGYEAPRHEIVSTCSDDLAIGSPWCPTETLVCEALSRIKSALREASKARAHARCFRLHAYYTVLMLEFAVGFRGFRTPYIPPTAIHKSGITVVTDKLHCRYMWVPPLVVAQIRLYARFADSMFQFAAAEGHSKTPECYLLDDAWQIQEISAATMAPLFQEFLPFPTNVARHFMRTSLIERGIPPEEVDAWCGHWFQGEEPWGRYSTFSPVLYRERLGKAVEQLLLDLGFEPIDFKGNPREKL